LIANPDVVPVLSEPIHPGLPPLSTTKDSLEIIQQYRGLSSSSITDTKSGLAKPDPASIAFLAYLKRRNLEIATREDEEAARKVLAGAFRLMDIGIDGLSFSLNAESLHRVYSRGSFDYNGRAYGAIHQNLPKHMRRYIRIDQRPTAELDFSAYHIRMLYHREGIDYQDDPYVVPAGPEMRDTFKAVGLIAINAASPEKAYGAIRDELAKRGIPLPQRKKPLVWLVETFRAAHPAIEKHLFSDAGIWLQNLDGNIMNAIVMRLMERGVLGLPVHDSVVVQREHEDVLQEIMMREYEAVMRFRPPPPERKG
jgi:hypothetical protein